jgi:hypothetical protein
MRTLKPNAWRPKPPLCQECAKTARHGRTYLGQEENQLAAELGVCRRHRTVRNAVDAPAGIYTPAVGGSIPSAPTGVHAGQRHTDPIGFDGHPCAEMAKIGGSCCAQILTRSYPLVTAHQLVDAQSPATMASSSNNGLAAC